jgi:hypothetical protein
MSDENQGANMAAHQNPPFGADHLVGGRHTHHHAPPHHRWLYNAEGLVTPDQASELLARFAASISKSGGLELAGGYVKLPEQVRAVVRHEILPRGETVVKIELVWNGPHDVAGRSINELLD